MITPLELAVEMASKAGEIIKNYFGQKLKRHIKGSGANDFATDADLRSEAYIIEQIQINFPEDGIIAEEKGLLKTIDAKNIWIIDPLDGTHNFTHGVKDCGVMIARITEDKVQLSVLYNPFKDMLVTAQRNKGVFVNGQRKHINLDKTQDLSIIADDNGFAPILKKQDFIVSDRWSCVDNALSIVSQENNAYFNKTAKIWDLSPISLCFEEYGLCVMGSGQKPYQWDSGIQTLIAIPQSKLLQIREILERK
jgi:fructose-1,6-bisphosphatase/inositol monophosphatase family enzyme